MRLSMRTLNPRLGLKIYWLLSAQSPRATEYRLICGNVGRKKSAVTRQPALQMNGLEQ
jgi:hypothetical protein